MAKNWLIALLVVEIAAAWWSFSAQKTTELLIQKTEQIKQEITLWEKTMADKTETRNGLLQLAYLSWQIYEDDRAKLFWERAFYLDPGLVASLPLQLF